MYTMNLAGRGPVEVRVKGGVKGGVKDTHTYTHSSVLANIYLVPLSVS